MNVQVVPSRTQKYIAHICQISRIRDHPITNAVNIQTAHTSIRVAQPEEGVPRRPSSRRGEGG